MLNVEELLKEPEIAEYLEHHDDKAVKKAAELLVEKTDAKEALASLLNAFEENKINVFFSYKKKDQEAATTIVENLKKWSAGKLDIAYMADFPCDLAGKDWKERIHSAIAKTHWFILLLPDPKDDWDWPLYETGFFDRKVTSAHRLICLHHPNVEVPSPIVDYQSVPATKNDVEDFLRMVFIKDNPVYGMGPLNEALVNDISEMADVIVNAISTPIERYKQIYEPWVELSIHQPELIKTQEQLDEAIVVSANSKALELFGLIDQQNTWGELRENVIDNPETNGQWLKELLKVISKIAKGHQYRPIQAVFQAPDGKMYKPVVCAVERDGKKGPIRTIHLTFTEDACAVDRSAMPQSLSMLANLLRSAFRMRWEVLEKFSSEDLTIDDVERLENALLRIEHDWESRNLGGAGDIVEIFPEGEGGNRLTEMMRSWTKARNQVKTGSLDIAIAEKDTETISKILTHFKTMNQEFLEIAAERFFKIIARQ